MSDWKPGFRHQVKWMSPLGVQLREAGGYWLCQDCGQRFERWPYPDQECPGPPADADPLHQEVVR
jgi:hypothetical protein